jgi:hypothetical protein
MSGGMMGSMNQLNYQFGNKNMKWCRIYNLKYFFKCLAIAF